MNLAALRCFHAVVEQGSVLAAARTLHRVPSNVSTRLRQLEDELGTTLFERGGRRLAPNAAGTTLYGYAQRILALCEEARSAVRPAQDCGELRLGSMESTAASRLPGVLSRLHARLPELVVELRTDSTAALLAQLRDGMLDAAFVADFVPDAELDGCSVFDEALVIVAPASHRPIASAGDVAGDTLLSFAAGCAYRDRLWRWVDHARHKALELTSYHAIIACVASGTGVALVPRSVLDTVAARDGVAVYPLGGPLGRSTTSLVWRRDDTSPRHAALLGALAAD